MVLALMYVAVQIRQHTAAMEGPQRLSRVDAIFRRPEQISHAPTSGARSEDMTETGVRARFEGVDSLTKAD